MSTKMTERDWELALEVFKNTEIAFFLAHTARYLTKDPGREDVLSTFAGIRPLVASDGDSYRYLAESIRKHPPQDELAAILATLVAHRDRQQAAQIVQRNSRDVSNWKWFGRWERMQR